MRLAAFRTFFAFVGLLSLVASTAAARPFYFDTFTANYGITSGDDLFACGVCHRLWEGTGGRNPYGLLIEQELYTGKTISDAILSAELVDSDLDGFTNVDEITIHETLPGYSCDNYDLAFGGLPGNFQSLIEPGVPTCLEPKDLEVTPAGVSFITEVGDVGQQTVLLTNNGFSSPVTVTGISFVPSQPATISIVAPSLPVAIPVGSSEAIDISFTPVATSIIGTTLRITSDDPDEPTIDVLVSATGFVIVLASADDRANCLKDVSKSLQKYSKTHLKEWARCYTDEAQGKACDTGKRDLKVQKAEVKLRRVVGGDRDKSCEARELLPSLLGYPSTCPSPCGTIDLIAISDIAECLVCQQEAATSAMLSATSGVTPPDFPSAGANLLVAKCARQLSKGVEKSVPKIHKTLAACELSNITAVSPVDCAAANAAEIAKRQSFANSRLDKCKDTTGLEGCSFGVGADPNCLGDAALSIASDLVDLTFGLE